MLPLKIENCPIIDTVVEIRFISNLFPNAVFGMIYNLFQKDYNPQVEKLPILQIPDQLRDIDPNFKFKPHYKLHNDRFSVQIGPDVIAISSSIPYVGWADYSTHICIFLEKLFELNIITQVIRLGVRYVNFFEADIFSSIKLSLSIDDNEHKCNNTLIRTEILKNDFINTVHIANNVNHVVNGRPIIGSIIDIDTSRNYPDAKFISGYKTEVESAHDSEKELFFSLLKDDFLNSLKPIFK